LAWRVGVVLRLFVAGDRVRRGRRARRPHPPQGESRAALARRGEPLDSLAPLDREAGMSDQDFARLVSLACHDLRTPLATVHGFARTIARRGDLGEPESRYVAMIEAASDQLAELLEELSLAARIEGGRYDPTAQETDSLTLATA